MLQLVRFTPALAAVLLLHCPAVFGRATPEQVGVQIAEAFNAQDAQKVVQLIDLTAFSRDLVRDLGLTPEQATKVQEGMRSSLRNNIEIGLRSFAQKQGVAKFIRAGKQAGRTYTLVRVEYQSDDGGFDYIQYYVTPAGLIADWYTHTRGALASTSMRLAVSSMLDKNSMLSTLFGIKSVDGQEVARFRTFNRHLVAGDHKSAYRALEDLPEAYKQTKDWAMLRTNVGGYDEVTYRAALEHLARNFSDDASVQFMLVDHYFYQERYDQAHEAVAAFEANVGEDGVTNFLKCSCLLSSRRYDDAVKACQRAMAIEPDFKSAYWGSVTAGIESNNPQVALSALSAYEQTFQVQFNPDVLAKSVAYRELARTPEFAAWAKQRR